MNEMGSRVARLVAIAEERFAAHRDAVYVQTDRLLGRLLIGEYVFAIAVAVLFSPYAWEGKTRVVHVHVPLAVVLGAVIVSLPVALAFLRPGQLATRHVIAAGQVLMSALLIHLSGGRIETHFHIFGSLAFLAFYRDWKVLITGSVIVTVDHFLRGLFYPESIYGVTNPEWWRFLEHVFWVLFIDAVLLVSCRQGTSEMRKLAEQSAQLEALAQTHSMGVPEPVA